MIAGIKNFYSRSYLIPPFPFEEEDKSIYQMGIKGKNSKENLAQKSYPRFSGNSIKQENATIHNLSKLQIKTGFYPQKSCKDCA